MWVVVFPVCFCVGDVPVCGDDTWRDPETAAGDPVDTKVPLYIYIQIHMYTCSQCI